MAIALANGAPASSDPTNSISPGIGNAEGLMEVPDVPPAAPRIIGYLPSPVNDQDARDLDSALSAIKIRAEAAASALQGPLEEDIWVPMPPRMRTVVQMRFVLKGRGRPDPPPADAFDFDA